MIGVAGTVEFAGAWSRAVGISGGEGRTRGAVVGSVEDGFITKFAGCAFPLIGTVTNASRAIGAEGDVVSVAVAITFNGTGTRAHTGRVEGETGKTGIASL